MPLNQAPKLHDLSIVSPIFLRTGDKLSINDELMSTGENCILCKVRVIAWQKSCSPRNARIAKYIFALVERM